VRHFAALLVLVAAAFAGTAATADEARFRAGPGAASLPSGATGLYELGTVGLGHGSAQVRALVHHGRILQVHALHDGRWLAKRSGSSGGKTAAPPKFDELAAIAGGINVDLRDLPAPARERFIEAAGLVLLDSGSHGAATGPGGAAGTEGFAIRVDTDNATWRFEGFGIVAIWPVP